MEIAMIDRLLHAILRRKTPILFQEFTRTAPVSTVFGLDRGTPIDRYYIETFLRKNAHLIKGRVLEIGESVYCRRYGGENVEAYEVLYASDGNESATILGDLTDAATLPENAIDCFVCTQTFNFIFDVQKAVAGAHYLLKPGGVILATVAGISQISRYDMDRWGDYWRFTTASARKLFEPLYTGGVKVECFGNVMASCAYLQGLAVEDLPVTALLDEHDPDYQMLITIVARKGF
jgi:Methyltransferase domain